MAYFAYTSTIIIRHWVRILLALLLFVGTASQRLQFADIKRLPRIRAIYKSSNLKVLTVGGIMYICRIQMWYMTSHASDGESDGLTCHLTTGLSGARVVI